jgi:hypothetical protein
MQCVDPRTRAEEDVTTHGVLVEDAPVIPSGNDCIVAESILAEARKTDGSVTIHWPSIDRTAVSEYDQSIKIFAMAFPWLFPGGVGDYTDFRERSVTATDWAKRMIMYEDGRFASDKMFCFFALNYVVRRRNQSSGNFFVDTFSSCGKTDLADLQLEIANGNMKFVNEITYFSLQVKGSDAYWRNQRSQVYSWINHHVEMQNGPPNFFITLSCAEYFWPDILRLVEDRMFIATGKRTKLRPNQDGIVQIMNDYSAVVQEYFQQRVEIWLKTVGKKVFGIDHYWIRYEFAPSRGQIHAHIVAICNDKRVRFEMHEHRFDDKAQAEVLAKWASEKFGLTAELPCCETYNEGNGENKECSDDPVSIYFSSVKDIVVDSEKLMQRVEIHKCSSYCLRASTKKEKLAYFHERGTR